MMVRTKMSESLREAVTFIEQGHVRVGPQTVTEPAFLVTRMVTSQSSGSCLAPVIVMMQLQKPVKNETFLTSRIEYSSSISRCSLDGRLRPQPRSPGRCILWDKGDVACVATASS